MLRVGGSISDSNGSADRSSADVHLLTQALRVANSAVAAQQPLVGLLVAIAAQQRQRCERAVVHGDCTLLDPLPVEADCSVAVGRWDDWSAVACEGLVGRPDLHCQYLPTAGGRSPAIQSLVDLTVAVVVNAVADLGGGRAARSFADPTFVDLLVAVVVAAVADFRAGSARPWRSGSAPECGASVGTREGAGVPHLRQHAPLTVDPVTSVDPVDPVDAVGAILSVLSLHGEFFTVKANEDSGAVVIEVGVGQHAGVFTCRRATVNIAVVVPASVVLLAVVQFPPAAGAVVATAGRHKPRQGRHHHEGDGKKIDVYVRKVFVRTLHYYLLWFEPGRGAPPWDPVGRWIGRIHSARCVCKVICCRVASNRIKKNYRFDLTLTPCKQGGPNERFKHYYRKRVFKGLPSTARKESKLIMKPRQVAYSYRSIFIAHFP